MAVLGSGKVDIDTYGELKILITAITRKQKGLKIKGIVIDTIADELIGKLPGGPTAKKTLDFVKAAFGKPDSVKTNTWLDKLDVDDQLSAIVDDTIENKFLQDISKRIEGQSDNTPLRQDFNMNTELVDFLKKNYKGRTVVGPQNENKKMKRSNITSILREILTEDIDTKRSEHLGILIGSLYHIQTLLKMERPHEEVLSYVNRALDQVKSSDILRKGTPEMEESALSPGYLTNVYSDNERLEATVYKDGRASITVRGSNGGIVKSTAAVPLTALEDSIKNLELGLDDTEIESFVNKVMSNEKVKANTSV